MSIMTRDWWATLVVVKVHMSSTWKERMGSIHLVLYSLLQYTTIFLLFASHLIYSR